MYMFKNLFNIERNLSTSCTHNCVNANVIEFLCKITCNFVLFSQTDLQSGE